MGSRVSMHLHSKAFFFFGETQPSQTYFTDETLAHSISIALLSFGPLLSMECVCVWGGGEREHVCTWAVETDVRIIIVTEETVHNEVVPISQNECI